MSKRAQDPTLRDLLRIARAREREFRALRRANLHAGAAYAALLLVEALLKAAACRQIDSPTLPRELWTHDLRRLALFAGLTGELGRTTPFSTRFECFQTFLQRHGTDLRYRNPAFLRRRDVDEVAAWLFGADGMVRWLHWRIR